MSTIFTKSLVSCLIRPATAAVLALVTTILVWPGREPSLRLVKPPWNFLCHLKASFLDTADVLCIWHNSLYVCEPEMFRLMRPFIQVLITKHAWVFNKHTQYSQCITTAHVLTSNNFWKREQIQTKFRSIIQNHYPVKLPRFPWVSYSHVVSRDQARGRLGRLFRPSRPLAWSLHMSLFIYPEYIFKLMDK